MRAVYEEPSENRLKGQATMLLNIHQIPKGLLVDEVFRFWERPKQMAAVENEQRGEP